MTEIMIRIVRLLSRIKQSHWTKLSTSHTHTSRDYSTVLNYNHETLTNYHNTLNSYISQITITSLWGHSNPYLQTLIFSNKLVPIKNVHKNLVQVL